MPKTPLCDRCPVAPFCAAFARGDQASFPRKAKKAERPRRYGVAYVLIRGDEVALVRRPPKGLLGGMLALPTSEWRSSALSEAEAFEAVPTSAPWRSTGEIEHLFTHFALTLKVMRAESAEAFDGAIWTSIDEVGGLPSVFLKALRSAINGLL